MPNSHATTVADLLANATGPLHSFEYYPPRSEEEEAMLLRSVKALAPLEPDFVSVTYGATGSKRDRTIQATRAIAEIGNPLTVGHLTCVDQSKAEIAEALAQYADAGVNNILAVRGDMPGGGEWRAHPDGLKNATELVKFIKEQGDFCVGVAAFTSPHPDSQDADLDAQILLEKEEAGAEYAITQLFFETNDYFTMVERIRGLGSNMPIIPGIMPLTVITQIERFEELAGAPLPADFVAKLRAAKKPEVRGIGLAHAEQMCRDLIAGGAPGLQFFTQNRSKATREVLSAVLGIDA